MNNITLYVDTNPLVRSNCLTDTNGLPIPKLSWVYADNFPLTITLRDTGSFGNTNGTVASIAIGTPGYSSLTFDPCGIVDSNSYSASIRLNTYELSASLGFAKQKDYQFELQVVSGSNITSFQHPITIIHDVIANQLIHVSGSDFVISASYSAFALSASYAFTASVALNAAPTVSSSWASQSLSSSAVLFTPTASNIAYYIPFTTGSGYQQLLIDTSSILYNPSKDLLIVQNISASLLGTASLAQLSTRAITASQADNAKQVLFGDFTDESPPVGPFAYLRGEGGALLSLGDQNYTNQVTAPAYSVYDETIASEPDQEIIRIGPISSWISGSNSFGIGVSFPDGHPEYKLQVKGNTNLDGNVSIGALDLAGTNEGNNNLSVGEGHSVSGNNNIAAGIANSVIGDNNVVMGVGNTVTATGSFVFGSGNTVSTDDTFLVSVPITLISDPTQPLQVTTKQYVDNGNFTSSWSNNAKTASFVTASNVRGTVTSASYATTSSFSSNSNNAISASYSTTGVTSSYSVNLVQSQSNIAFSATTSIDFNGPAYQQLSLTSNNIYLTGSNYGIGKSVTLEISASSSLATIGYPSTWVFFPTASNTIPAGGIGLLALKSNGTTDSGVRAILVNNGGNLSASYSNNSTSASYSTTSSFSSVSSNSTSASYSITSSFSSVSISASYSLNSSTASFVTASNVVGTITSASYARSASFSPASVSASYLNGAAFSDRYALNTGFVNAYTASFSLTNNDNGRYVSVISGAAVNVTVSSSLDTNFSCLVFQSGSGQVSIITGSTDTTLRNRQSQIKIAGQYGVVSLVRVPSGDFILSGDTGA